MTEQEKYIIARWMYCIGVDFISDMEYDRLHRSMVESGMLSEYTSRGWNEDPCPSDLLRKHGMDEHINNAVYTYKTESIESLNDWDSIKARCGSISEVTRISYKLDGFNFRISYFNGEICMLQLRNRLSKTSKDVYHLKGMFPKTIPYKGKVLIIGELYLRNVMFEEYKKLRGVKSQRNAVASAIANSDFRFLGFKAFHIYGENVVADWRTKYSVLQSIGFSTPMHVVIDSYDAIAPSLDKLGKRLSIYDAPTDGVVLENSTMQYALRVGAWEEENNYSYVTGYNINRGKYGNNLLVSIYPIDLGQKVINEIDIDNIQTIIDNDLRIGSPIAFSERSGVNSIIDTSKTSNLQMQWAGEYDAFKRHVEAKYRGTVL